MRVCAAMFMRLFSIALLAALPTMASATPDDFRNLASMRGRSRVLLVFAPTLKDGRLIAQQREFARFGVGAAARDLVLVQVGGDTVLGSRDRADRLRTRFHAPAPAYRAVLIGKDGNAALTEASPITAPRLQATIDAMPMRQDEVRRAKAGLGPTR